MDAAPNLRAISNYAVGVDNVDVEAATARGIPVGNTPDVLTESTADLALALMLAIARRLGPAGLRFQRIPFAVSKTAQVSPERRRRSASRYFIPNIFA